MPRIPDNLIQEISAKTDFTGLFSQYLTLRQQGRKFIALCPFHGEKTPSFSIDPDQGMWYCFGCHAGGNLFKFVMQIEGWTFQEAARELGKRVGVDVDDLTPEERDAYNKKQELRDLVKRVALHYHELLLSAPMAEPARQYLSKRGVGAEVTRTFQLGYAPAGPTYLLEWSSAHRISAEDLVAAGLATDKTRSGRTVDSFRDRVMFPISDPHGQPIAMGGRILGDGQPKYLNSPETALFSKRSNLYGLYQARNAIRDNSAILVEGYMDVVTLHQAGFCQAVASLGTALTEQQAALLRRYCDTCVLAYDADNAGQSATEKGIEIFETAGLTARIVTMAPGDDPDSLIKRSGPAAFRERLEAAHSIIDYKMDQLKQRLPLNTAEGQSAFLRQIMPLVDRIRDRVRRSIYLKTVADITNVGEETIHRLASTIPGSHGAPAPRSYYKQQDPKPNLARNFKILETARATAARTHPAPSAVNLAADQNAEKTFVGYLLAHPESLQEAEAAVPAPDIQDPVLRTILMRLYELRAQQRTLRAAELFPLLDQEGMAGLEGVDKRVSELLLGEKSEPLTPQLFAGLIKRFQIRRDRAELEFLKPIIEKGIKDHTITPEDPKFVKFKQLKIRLKGSK